MNAKTVAILEEVRKEIEGDISEASEASGYHPAKEIEGQFTKAIGYCLKHKLLSLSETKEIAKVVADIANKKYKNWSAR